MYSFLLNMWIMKKITESQIQIQVTKGKITQPEYNTIVAAPQVQ